MGRREEIAVDKRRKRKYRRLSRYEKKAKKTAKKQAAREEKARKKAEKREKRKSAQRQKRASVERGVQRPGKLHPEHAIRQRAVGSTVNEAKKKADKKAEEKRLSAQKSIPYREMARMGSAGYRINIIPKPSAFMTSIISWHRMRIRTLSLKIGVISSIILTAVSISSCRLSTIIAI